MSVYETLVRRILFALDPEIAHEFAIGALRRLSLVRVAAITKRVELFGLKFRNRVGLAAGFDKNGVALPAWEAMGFGFAEIGTVTAHPQPGNPKPRIFRYPAQQAIVNRLGFNNDGAVTIAARLRQLRESGRWPRIPIGINIGKSKIAPLERAADDYLSSFRTLRDFADYVAVNVSSPNTAGLRELQDAEQLGRLLDVLQNENAGAKPLLVKIAPDLAIQELEQVIATCEAKAVAGLIATNTTLDHRAVSNDQAGGLSGAPLLEKSNNIIRAIRARSQLPIIGVGGITNTESAQSKIDAGAQLIQIYTGLIYRGPSLIRAAA